MVSVKKERKTMAQKARVTLQAPYSLHWPTLELNLAREILDELTRTFAPLGMSKLRKLKLEESTSNSTALSRQDKNELKRQQCKDKWDKCKCHRQHLVLGMSNALRSLEKDELCALLLCRDVSPQQLFLEPFASLCVSRDVRAAVAISKLGETMQKVLNFKSCKALGLKRSVAEDPSNVFHELYKLIRTKAPTLQRKNLDAAIISTPPSKTKTIPPKVAADHPAVERPPDKDYAHLYVKKTDVKLDFFQRQAGVAEEFISLGKSDETSEDSEVKFLSVNLERKKEASAYKQMQIKRIKPSNKIKKNKRLQKRKPVKI